MVKSKEPKAAVTDIESLRTAVCDYAALHAQIKETALKGKPMHKRLGELKRALTLYMADKNMKSLELPNKDLLVLTEAVKKPSLSDKYLHRQFTAYFNDEEKAEDLLAFLRAVPDDEIEVKASLKHVPRDAYVETESTVDDDEQ